MNEFSSQVLNRDLWKDKSIETLLEAQCVFWQAARGADDVDRVCALYNFDRLPIIAAIDPRTSECIRLWHGADVNANRFADDCKFCSVRVLFLFLFYIL